MVLKLPDKNPVHIATFRMLRNGVYIESLGSPWRQKDCNSCGFCLSLTGRIVFFEDKVRLDYPFINQIAADVWSGEHVPYKLCGFEQSRFNRHSMIKKLGPPLNPESIPPTLHQYLLNYKNFQQQFFDTNKNETSYDKAVRYYVHIE